MALERQNERAILQVPLGVEWAVPAMNSPRLNPSTGGWFGRHIFLLLAARGFACQVARAGKRDGAPFCRFWPLDLLVDQLED